MKLSTTAPAGRRRHLARTALVGAGAIVATGLTMPVAFAAPATFTLAVTPSATAVTVNDPVFIDVVLTNVDGDDTETRNISSFTLTTPGDLITYTSPGSGQAGTGCAGAAFTVGPSVGGTRTITAPALAIPDTGTCTVRFTGLAAQAGSVAVSATVVVTDNAPGTESSAPVVAASPLITIAQAPTSIVSIASKSNATITDSASLSGRVNPVDGTLTFNLYGPDDANCTGAVIATTSRVVGTGNGPFTSDPYTATAPGTYRYVVSYSGDVNNAPVTAACNAPGESVEITQADIDAGNPNPEPEPEPEPGAPTCAPGSPNTGNNNRGYGNSGNNNRGNCNSGNNNRGDNNDGNNNRP